ncbi:MAG: ROK family protein [Pirellulales bacterium]|nr:ROK family protein [Pirellulales bacterium]
MILAIEIGGTKLQLAVGVGDGTAFVAQERFVVDQSAGATGILETIAAAGKRLAREHQLSQTGIGFGGPVNSDDGTVVKSHHVSGWDGFPLAEWARREFDLPAIVENDAHVAALGEARLGAGRGCDPVLYVTVGSGVGGGLVHAGEIFCGHAPAVCELGHLRPGFAADSAEQTVESIASGWSIAEAVRSRLTSPEIYRLTAGFGKAPSSPEVVRQRLIEAEEADEADAADLLDRCDADLTKLNACDVALAAEAGNRLAADVFDRAVTALGWSIAQAVTLCAPRVVVVGGGVSLAGEDLFFRPLRKAAQRYVFPPLANSFEIRPAALGEDVVLHGAAVLARGA